MTDGSGGGIKKKNTPSPGVAVELEHCDTHDDSKPTTTPGIVEGRPSLGFRDAVSCDEEQTMRFACSHKGGRCCSSVLLAVREQRETGTQASPFTAKSSPVRNGLKYALFTLFTGA